MRVVLFGSVLCCAKGGAPAPADIEWAQYSGDPTGTRYSPALQVNRRNVPHLREVWRISLGDSSRHSVTAATALRRSRGPLCARCRPNARRFESTPLMWNGTLYATSVTGKVYALDPVTGRTRWMFDPGVDTNLQYPEGLTSRGLSSWSDPVSLGTSCRRRLFVTTVDARILALDADRGSLCRGFGIEGTVRFAERPVVISHPKYSITSPAAILGDLVIVGATAPKNGARPVPGIVKAFDARTGRQVWSFQPLGGKDSAQTHSTAAVGGGAVWSLMSVDQERDLVFLPTSSAGPDHYGGNRPGENRFASSVVAVRGTTGQVVWSFQVVHHDLWDYDLAAAPVPANIIFDGGTVAALIVGSKTGMIYVLNRETGAPLYPIEERAVPRSDIPGENTSPTQPFSTHLPQLHGTRLTADSAFGATSAERAFCRRWIAALRNDGIFTAPSLEGTLLWPGFWGGLNWDGLAWHPGLRRLVVLMKRVGMVVQLTQRGRAPMPQPSSLGIEASDLEGTPYVVRRMPLVAPSGNPCTPPPWSSLSAIDFDGGTLRWTKAVGTVPWLESHARYADWGSIAFGGAMVTDGGLVFVASSQDDVFRAMDIDTGETLWKTVLPAGWAGDADDLRPRRQAVRRYSGGGKSRHRYSGRLDHSVLSTLMWQPSCSHGLAAMRATPTD